MADYRPRPYCTECTRHAIEQCPECGAPLCPVCLCSCPESVELDREPERIRTDGEWV